MNLSVNIDAVRQLGKTIGDQAAEYNSEIAKIYSINDEVKQVWRGTASESYTSKVDSYRTNMESLGKAIEEYSQYLLGTAVPSYENMRDSISAAAGRL